MTGASLALEGKPPLKLVRLAGVERLGEASTFEIEVVGPKDQLVLPATVMRKACLLTLEGDAGFRSVAGLCTRFVVVETDHQHLRTYRMTVRARFALLELRRVSRNFQDLTVVEVLDEVVKAAGYAAVHKRLQGSYVKHRYVV